MKIKELILKAFKQFESNDYEHLAVLKEAFVNPKQTPNFMHIGSHVGFTCSMSIELQSLKFKPPVFLQVALKITDFETRKSVSVVFDNAANFSIVGNLKGIERALIEKWLEHEANLSNYLYEV